MKNNQKFHEWLKELRLQMRISLREFCRLADEDPANFSKIERGLKVPPGDEILERYGKALGLSEKKLQDFISLGALSRRDLPKHLSEEELTAKLPAFLRLINGEFPSEENLREAASVTREANNP